MAKISIKEGDVYGLLTVVNEGDRLRLPSGQSNRTANCVCKCGNKTNVRLSHLIRHKIKSCGCINKTMYGRSRTGIGILYKSVKRRVSEKHSEPHLYFLKGIKMCEEWAKDFLSFEKWCLNNGYKKGLQLDRIDGNKDYSPNNCRFVTPKVNCNNKENTIMVTYKGELRPLKLVLESLKKDDSYYTIRTRILRGWDHDKAIDTPSRKGNYKTKRSTI